MKQLLYVLLLTIPACQSKTERQTITTKRPDSTGTQETKAYVLKENEGEELKDIRGRTLTMKISPESGAKNFSAWTQYMPKGQGVTEHRHDKTEEILYVKHGNGIAIVNGDSVKIEEGSTIFIPPGTWHAVYNPNDSMNIFFIASPQGLEKLIRRIGSPPGTPLKTLTEEQRDSIGEVSDSKTKKTH
jgi:quercetin dioxygenase-like cupin family protein